MIFLLQAQKREIFSMTPGKHVQHTDVELISFYFLVKYNSFKSYELELKKKDFFVTRVFEYV